MQDFGYKKKFEKKPAKLQIKFYGKIFTVFFIFFIFSLVSFKAFKKFGNSKTIPIIEGPNHQIKITPDEESADGKEIENNLVEDKLIYEDIFGKEKESVNKNKTNLVNAPSPALPKLEFEKIEQNEINPQKIGNPEVEQLPQIIDLQQAIENGKKAEKQQEKNKLANNKEENSQNNKKIEPKLQENSPQKNEDNKSNLKNKLAVQTTNFNGSNNKKTPKELEEFSNEPKKAKIEVKISKIGKIKVQLAALSSKNSAEKLWQELQKENNKLFKNLSPTIEEANLGKRGVFFRLKAGNFFNQIEAENFCKKYISFKSKSGADCLIVE